MPFHPRGNKSFFPEHKSWKKYPRTRYKSTAWRKDAWSFLAKKNTQRHYGSFLRNALERTRANRAAKNQWAAHYTKFNTKLAKGAKAIRMQADWRWRNR